MKEGMRSVITAAGISAGCLCVWWGSGLRDRLDVGSSLTASSSNRVLSTWVASRDNQTNVPAADYYSQMVSLLKQYYVEPIKDDEKLADGSVRGMVNSLGDPESTYMDPEEFQAYLNREKGIYEGIGVNLVLQTHGKKTQSSGIQPPPEDAEEAVAVMSRFPTVRVDAVVPGSPADKAGVKVGDAVADVDGHWVVEDSLLERFKRAREAFQAKKMTFSEIEPLQRELRDKTQRALLPNKVPQKLLIGKSGTVNITWSRNGQERKTVIEKAVSEMPGFKPGDPITLPMTDAATKSLKESISGHGSLTIDLRDDAAGSFGAMMADLELLVPAGHYGEIVSQRQEPPTPVNVAIGNSKPPKIQLLVSDSTRGPAAIFAKALATFDRAILVGQLPTSPVSVQQDVELPAGAGYDLVIGSYRPINSKSKPGTKTTDKVAVGPKGIGNGVIADRHSYLRSENTNGTLQGGIN